MNTYHVFVQTAPGSPWRDTGVIESNLATANKAWSSIIQRLERHAYKLVLVQRETGFEP